MDSLTEGIDAATVPQAIQKLETHMVANRDSSIANDTDDIGKLWNIENIVTTT